MENLKNAIEQARNKAQQGTRNSTYLEDEEIKVVNLINETNYFLNKSKTKNVSIGLAPQLAFSPVLKICGNNNNNNNQSMVFEKEEWLNLLDNETNLRNYFQSGDVHWAPVSVGSKLISFHTIKYKKVIKITKSDSELWLGWESVVEMFHLAHLINKRWEFLTLNTFESFYKNLISGVASMAGDHNVNIINILTTLNEVDNAANALYMMEMLYFEAQKVLVDIEIAKCIV